MIQSISPKSILFHLHRCCQLLSVTSSSTHESWPFKPNPKVHRKKSQEVYRFSNYEMSHGEWGRSFESPQVLKHECIYIYIRVYFNIRATYLKLQIIYKNPSCFTSCFNKRMSWKTICISPGHVFEKALLCSSIHCNLLSQAEVPWPAIGSNGGKDGSPDLKESRVSVWSKSRCIILYNIWYDNGIYVWYMYNILV